MHIYGKISIPVRRIARLSASNRKINPIIVPKTVNFIFWIFKQLTIGNCYIIISNTADYNKLRVLIPESFMHIHRKVDYLNYGKQKNNFDDRGLAKTRG